MTEWVSKDLTSQLTYYRSFQGWFSQAKRPMDLTNSIKALKEANKTAIYGHLWTAAYSGTTIQLHTFIQNIHTVSVAGEVALVMTVPDDRLSNVAVIDWIWDSRLLSIWGTCPVLDAWVAGTDSADVFGICWANCCCSNCSCSRLSVGSSVYKQQILQILVTELTKDTKCHLRDTSARQLAPITLTDHHSLFGFHSSCRTDSTDF